MAKKLIKRNQHNDIMKFAYSQMKFNKVIMSENYNFEKYEVY